MAHALGDEEAIKEAKTRRCQATAALMRREQQDGKIKRAPKMHRKKAYEWLCCLHHVLAVATGFGGGLRDFCVPEADRASLRSPLEWPLAIVACDRGSDGVSGSSMRREKLRLNVDFHLTPRMGLGAQPKKRSRQQG